MTVMRRAAACALVAALFATGAGARGSAGETAGETAGRAEIGPIQVEREKLRELKTGIADALASRRVPADVRLRVSIMIDLAARATPWRDVMGADFPPPREYPSVARQLKIQAALNQVARNFRREHPFRGITPDVHIEMPPPPRTDYRGLLRQIPAIIRGAQGAFSQAFEESAETYRSLGQAPSRRDTGRWARPLTLSATGVAEIDRSMSDQLAALRTRGVAITMTGADPTAAAAAAIRIGSPRDGSSSLDRLSFCVEQAACAGMAFLVHATPRAAPRDAAEKRRFLDRLYLRDPYGEGDSALLEIAANGERIAAYCDPPWRSGRPGDAPETRRFRDCLDRIVR